MAYKIELSLKLKQQSNITHTIDDIISNSYKHACVNHYVNYEYVYKKKIVIRNSCVISLTFDDEPKEMFVIKDDPVVVSTPASAFKFSLSTKSSH